MSHANDTWVQDLKHRTHTAQDCIAFLNQRAMFATRLAQALLNVADLERNSKTPILYAVYLAGHDNPIYVGQSTQGGRRLWDLPIGESHHLANSFPPELWGAVMVLRWRDLLEVSHPEVLQDAICRFASTNPGQPNALQALGLSLEYRLQLEFKPLFNLRKRRPDGAWRPVNLGGSKSIGAKASKTNEPIWEKVLPAWIQMHEAVTSHTDPIFKTSFGGMVRFKDETSHV